MSVNISRVMRKVYQNDIIFLKSGNVYSVYEIDTEILAFIFKYKANIKENAVNITTFSENAHEKIIERLNKLKINYVDVNLNYDYEVFNAVDFKNENKYGKYAVNFKSKKIDDLSLFYGDC